MSGHSRYFGDDRVMMEKAGLPMQQSAKFERVINRKIGGARSPFRNR